jgi:ubiquinone/menaquinone biosynthesis C-methylase UbiE
LHGFGGIGFPWRAARMSFDVLAPHYRWMEAVLAGEKLQRCRVAHLGQTGPAQNILIFGEGNGRFLVECWRAFPMAAITCVDGSARMLSLAKRRLQQQGLGANSVQFIHADALQWEPRLNAYDLLVTHFFLDCFRADQLERLIFSLAKGATAEAKWLVADFQIPAGGLARVRAKIIHRLMYVFFRIVTRIPARSLTSPDRYLEVNGFYLKTRQEIDHGLLRSDLWVRQPAMTAS